MFSMLKEDGNLTLKWKKGMPLQEEVEEEEHQGVVEEEVCVSLVMHQFWAILMITHNCKTITLI